MTIVLVSFGASFIAFAVFLLGKATDYSTTNQYLWNNWAFLFVFLSILCYAIALIREWKRERKISHDNNEREKREIERDKRDKEWHDKWMNEHRI